MARTLEFLFDFASPNGYLAYRALPPILARTDARLEITPVLLGGLFKATGNQAPMLAFANVKGKLDYDGLEIRRFIAKHGLTNFRINPHFPVITLMLMRGFVAARALGKGDEYLEMGLRGLWEEGLKLDDADVLARRIEAAGLDAKRVLEDAQRPDIKQSLVHSTARAAERGAFGVPTFFVGEEMFFGKERLGQVEEELLKVAA
jgi:2-hydroxychromene-2-carboxylate isomerase